MRTDRRVIRCGSLDDLSALRIGLELRLCLDDLLLQRLVLTGGLGQPLLLALQRRDLAVDPGDDLVVLMRAEDGLSAVAVIVR
jgi:hypothetical protein